MNLLRTPLKGTALMHCPICFSGQLRNTRHQKAEAQCTHDISVTSFNFPAKITQYDLSLSLNSTFAGDPLNLTVYTYPQFCSA